jgi:hypothetical protein
VWCAEAARLLSLVTDFNDNELADEGAERDAAAGRSYVTPWNVSMTTTHEFARLGI